jgi:hypothetical protein
MILRMESILDCKSSVLVKTLLQHTYLLFFKSMPLLIRRIVFVRMNHREVIVCLGISFDITAIASVILSTALTSKFNSDSFYQN